MTTVDVRLSQYATWLAEFAEDRLRPYLLRRAAEAPGSGRAKEFNDPIWGTLVLQPHEVVVLDSPLLQRLRRIRQLGVAHLVYPSAQHTRLEHSLGVAHQIERLAGSVNTHGVSDPPAVITDDQLFVLRLVRCRPAGSCW